MFVPLHCVFHSIRFKVNKGWSKALLLFLCLYLCIKFPFYKLFCYIRTILLILNYYYETLIYHNSALITIVPHAGTGERIRNCCSWRAGAMENLEDDKEKSTLYYAALDSALSIGNAILSAGGEGPEAVMAVVNYFENSPLFNAGKGATCTSAGTFELDASIMEGKDLTAGAVAGLKTVKNPINAAYAVKTKTPHVMLAGEGADRFAKSQGLEIVDNMYFATPKTLKWIEDLKKESKKNGTVGCVVLDKQGNLTAGTSTGGMFKKQWGRVGDSPVIGAGTYADNEGCAVSCTGHGEYFIRHVVAYNLSTRVKLLHQPVGEAADYIIHQELNTKEGNGGLIAVDKKGNFAMPFNSGGMFRGYLYKEKGTGKISKAVGIGKKMKTL